MPAPDPRVLMHLAQAEASINAALALLGAESAVPQVELPPGVEVVEPCRHPAEKIHRPIGGAPWCAACGAKLPRGGA